MARNLPYRLGGAVDGRDGLSRPRVPARVVRAVKEGIAIEEGRGAVRAAQVRAMQYVAQQALQAVGHLSRTEAIYARHVPHAAARLQAIADIAAMNLAEITAETGQD